MNRNQAKEFYPILQAYSEGRVIECRTKPNAVKGADVPNDWTEMKEIEFWNNIEYRVKPEPVYHPFNNTKECWQELLKHKPFGWVKDTEANEYLNVYCISNSVSSIDLFCRMFKRCIFIDGSPFGIKVEEDYNGIK